MKTEYNNLAFQSECELVELVGTIIARRTLGVAVQVSLS